MRQFAEEAAELLAAELSSGAEVAFELEPRRGRSRARSAGPVMYAYRALTDEFIAERLTRLERLPSYQLLTSLLEDFEGLEAYLAAVGIRPARGGLRARTRAALLALLREVFADQTDFELHPQRLRVALERLQAAADERTGETSLLGTLHGLTIGSAQLQLARGLTIAHPDAIEELPGGALFDRDAADGGGEHLVVMLGAGDGEPTEALARGRAVLAELLRALRLFGDGRVTLGALGWARIADGRWSPVALGSGGRPHGMLFIAPEQEDELRAFCNLISRRSPHANELAWALRRFELGCERSTAAEALSDHLLALRALLEPEVPPSGLLPGRLSALCATPEQRPELSERVLAALALERDLIGGRGAAPGAVNALAGEMADHLRALLRDVICGHLDTDLVTLADALLLAGSDGPQSTGAGGESSGEAGSVEQLLGQERQAGEMLDVFI